MTFQASSRKMWRVGFQSNVRLTVLVPLMVSRVVSWMGVLITVGLMRGVSLTVGPKRMYRRGRVIFVG